MPRVDLELSVDVARSPRVKQLEGMFDVPEAKRQTVDFHFDVPLDEQEWSIGLICGPSGAGKSSVARHLFPDALVESYDWDAKAAVVDSFGELGIREITEALSSVGFASPPSWMKPFSVLSNGEKFRATLARALTDPERDLVVMDEFTSVVDRQVAKVGSHAIAKSIRRQKGRKFVAVSCHDDIIDWLQPDWILEPHVGGFHWRSLQRRPELPLTLHRADHASWKWFAPHHYLTASLHRAARCFVGMIEGEPVAFAGVLHKPHPKNKRLASLSRLVVLPDYQGLGLGSRTFVEAVARMAWENNRQLTTHPSHPALVKVWDRSNVWERVAKLAPTPSFGPTTTLPSLETRHARFRRVAHYKWVGGGFDDPELRRQALALWR